MISYWEKSCKTIAAVAQKTKVQTYVNIILSNVFKDSNCQIFNRTFSFKYITNLKF